jgi:hypothetical protein
MGILYIRNVANTAWIDALCAGGYKIRNSTNTGWVQMTAANTFFRKPLDNGWDQATCTPAPSPVAARVLRVMPDSTLWLNTGPGTVDIQTAAWPGAGPAGANLTVYTGSNTNGWSARVWMRGQLATYSATAYPIVTGPNKGVLSNWVFNGTTYGYDIYYHPRMSVVSWNPTLARWEGGGGWLAASTSGIPSYALMRSEQGNYTASYRGGMWYSSLSTITYGPMQMNLCDTQQQGSMRWVSSYVPATVADVPYVGAPLGRTYYTIYEDLFGNGPGAIAPYNPYGMTTP